MRRRRPLIVWICLIALVWCQTSMAAQWCHGGAVDVEAVALDCHGAPIADDSSDARHCPGSDVVPDMVKLPVFAALPLGHDFPLTIARSESGAVPGNRFACPRDGPSLNALCRLLI